MARGSCVGVQGQGCSQLSQLDVRIAKQRALLTRLKEQWGGLSRESLAIGNTAGRLGNPISSSPTPSPMVSIRADEVMSVVTEKEENGDEPSQVPPTLLSENDPEASKVPRDC